MTYKESESKFKAHVDLTICSKINQLAISVCKRLFPDYQEFYLANNWGDPDILLDSIKLIDSDKNHILNVGTYLTDTIDFKIQETQILTEEEIDNHPLMVEARRFLLNSE